MAALRPLVVVDTDILIDVSRAEEQAVRFLQSLEASHRPVVSPITQMELFVGCRNKRELQQTVQFLKRFGVAHLNREIEEKAIDLLMMYRLSHGLLLADAFIAATALVLECPLASKNQRDYCFISDLRLLPYP